MMTDREYATPFSVLHAASLLGQRIRLDKFGRAIQRVVKKGDYVVDIGTGSGVLAILAAKAGANRVTAIDVNPESLLYAKKAAKMNAVENVVEFFEGSYSNFTSDQKADVVICEMLSSIMLVEQQIPACYHAVEKILKTDGVILPQEITVFIVPVECPEIWDRFQYEDLQFPRVVQTATSNATKDLANMKILEKFDLMNLKEKIIVDKKLQFTAVDNGTIHGLAGVFESKLWGDIQLHMDDGWKQLFIPLVNPIEVTNGDAFSIRIVYQPGKFDSLSVEVL
ncbi:MAG: 50S ribosomal protein L11 methyltransferase [Candidatus Sifarchaeia archaeon]